MKNDIYYENLTNDRKGLLYLLEKQILTIRVSTNLRNGRKLNRLSTRQLVAYKRRLDAGYSRRISNYVGFLDNVSMVGAN